ncbi:MAG: glutamine amidotransferase, partial [Vicinamibacterales bacterium]
RGYAGRTVTVDVEDEGRIVGSEQVVLPADGSQVAVRMRAMATEPGARTLRVRVGAQQGELVPQNNVRETQVEVRDRSEKILYFEGEPRFELKFIRRAVADDGNLHVVTLQRTADKKFYRLDVDKPEELVNGFPSSREELFSYRGLILGSVEAGAFTGEQLQMVADFVDKRGGGLLMLGGPRSFGEGGYAGTPIADALPVSFARGQTPPDRLGVVRLKIGPTREGSGHPLAQIAADERASARRWPELPELTVVNQLGNVKAGATVLLTGSDERRRNHVVLAQERYGRGKAMALAAQDTWRWQMHASIAVDDQTHETFWRQMLRWLVDGVPEAVEVRVPERVNPGDVVTVLADVVDAAFVEVNDATVVAHVTAPDGTVSDAPLTWGGRKAGEYRGTISTSQPGNYQVQIDATRSGRSLGQGTVHVQASAGTDEFVSAGMNAERLRRIADATGGRFYTADTLSRLPEDIRYSGRGVVSVEERELWNMPILLFLLIGFVCAEWRYRRSVGLG